MGPSGKPQRRPHGSQLPACVIRSENHGLAIRVKRPPTSARVAAFSTVPDQFLVALTNGVLQTNDCPVRQQVDEVPIHLSRLARFVPTKTFTTGGTEVAAELPLEP